MKKILLTLFLAMGLVSVAQATATATFAQSTTAAGALISTGVVGVTTLSSTASSCLGPGALIQRVLWSPATSGTAITWSLWDCPQGLTYGAGARKVTANIVAGTSFVGPQMLDFRVTDGGVGSRPDDGLYFKYFPVVVDADANTLNATFFWTQGATALKVPR